MSTRKQDTKYITVQLLTGLALVIAKLRASQMSSIGVIKQQGVGCTESNRSPSLLLAARTV